MAQEIVADAHQVRARLLSGAIARQRPLPVIALALGGYAWLAGTPTVPECALRWISLALAAGLLVAINKRPAVLPEARRHKRPRRCILLLFLLLSSLWFLGWRTLYLDRQLQRATLLAGSTGWVTGRVISYPNPARTDKARESVLLRMDNGLRVRIVMPTQQIGCGDRIRAFVTLRWPQPASTPGGFDEARWLRGQGVMLSGQTFGAAPTVLAHPTGWYIPRWFWQLRQALYRAFLRSVGAGQADFLAAVLFGDSGGLDGTLKEGFRLTGMAHILSVSGSHLALAAAPVQLLTGPSGLGRKRQLGIQVIWIGVFAALTGLRPAVCRALAMTCCARMGPLFMRRADGYSALSAAVIVLLWFKPQWIYDAGFLISICATIGILLAASPPMHARTRNRLWTTARVSCFAQAASLPLLMGATRTISWLSIPCWLVIMPLFGVLVPGALALGVFGLVTPLQPLARLLGILINWIHAFILHAASWEFARLYIPFWSPLAGCAIWSLLAAFASRRRRPKQTFRGLALGFVLLFFMHWGVECFLRPDLMVAFVDVGQGDCTWIHTRTGFNMLIDCGTESAGRDVVLPLLAWYGVRRLDCCLLTHGHADHAGGFESLAQRIKIDTLCLGDTKMPLPKDTEDLTEKVRICAEKNGIRVLQLRSGDRLTLTATERIDILHPPAGALPGNEGSLVTLLTTREFTILIAGDAGVETEERLLGADCLPEIDVLRVGHHGSKTATGADFLARILPKTAIISVGKNTYGHPAPETLQRLQARKVEVLRTDEDGTVIITWRGGKHRVACMLGGKAS